MPQVTVVMNCHNGERDLHQAIDSVLAQTFQDWEIVFWDNASTDATADIAKSYGGRLRYFRSPELLTLGHARRAAVEQARGDWIAFLDCDDWWFANKLQVQMEAVARTPCVLCYAGVEEVSESGQTIRLDRPRPGTGDLFERLLLQFDINMVTPLLRREVLVRHGLNFEPEVTASEEYNLFMRVAAKGAVLALPDVLGVYRVSSGSLTNRQISRWSTERHFTLDQLERENPGIESRYPRAFREARARGDYYLARYLVSLGDIRQAREVMKRITRVDWRYRALLAALYLPGAWNAIHRGGFKRILATRLASLFKGRDPSSPGVH